MRKTVRSTALVAMVGVLALAATACPTDPGPPQPAPGRYVATTGADTGDCATPATACLTVNYAVSQATAGQTVFVSAGTYPEMVSVDKPLTFSGPNAGKSAGTTPETRGAEATVKGFRSPGDGGSAHPTVGYQFNVTIDGFSVDPQGDTTLLTPNTHNLISLFGGTDVKIVNNIITGGPYDPACSYTCTTMADSAVMVRSGTYVVADNLVTNFRRPLDILQDSNATPLVSATYQHNVVQNFSYRAFWAMEDYGNGVSPFAAGSVKILDNKIDGTGAVANGATGAIVTAGGVTFSGNDFDNLDTGVFEMYCVATNASDIHTKYLDNTFTNTSLGLQLYIAGDCTGRNPGAKVTGNAFMGGLWSVNSTVTTGVAWYNGLPSPAPDASCNFWGDANGPGVGNNATAGAGITTSPWQNTVGAACP